MHSEQLIAHSVTQYQSGTCLTSKPRCEKLWHIILALAHLHKDELWLNSVNIEGHVWPERDFSPICHSRTGIEANKILHTWEEKLNFLIAFTQKNTEASWKKEQKCHFWTTEQARKKNADYK